MPCSLVDTCQLSVEPDASIFRIEEVESVASSEKLVPIY
jgi:hypothetical protein